MDSLVVCSAVAGVAESISTSVVISSLMMVLDQS